MSHPSTQLTTCPTFRPLFALLKATKQSGIAPNVQQYYLRRTRFAKSMGETYRIET
jgi:hypothetical protein